MQDYFVITKSYLNMNAMGNIPKSKYLYGIIIYYSACPQSIKNECTGQVFSPNMEFFS